MKKFFIKIPGEVNYALVYADKAVTTQDDESLMLVKKTDIVGLFKKWDYWFSEEQ